MLQGNVEIEALRKNGKIPFPPMSLSKIWSLLNFNQFCDINILKTALRETNASEEKKEMYKKYLQDPEELEKNPIRCQKLH